MSYGICNRCGITVLPLTASCKKKVSSIKQQMFCTPKIQRVFLFLWISRQAYPAEAAVKKYERKFDFDQSKKYHSII